MIDNPQLLQKVLDAPADDAPRLIYADWLEEHGDNDRTEFIRVQCALASQAGESPSMDANRMRACWLKANVTHDSAGEVGLQPTMLIAILSWGGAAARLTPGEGVSGLQPEGTPNNDWPPM